MHCLAIAETREARETSTSPEMNPTRARSAYFRVRNLEHDWGKGPGWTEPRENQSGRYGYRFLTFGTPRQPPAAAALPKVFKKASRTSFGGKSHEVGIYQPHAWIASETRTRNRIRFLFFPLSHFVTVQVRAALTRWWKTRRGLEEPFSHLDGPEAAFSRDYIAYLPLIDKVCVHDETIRID